MAPPMFRSTGRALALGCAACLFVSFLLSFPVGAWSTTVLRDNDAPGMSYHTLPERTRTVATAVRGWVFVWRWASLWSALPFVAAAALAQSREARPRRTGPFASR
jgi:hypothetical protein